MKERKTCRSRLIIYSRAKFRDADMYHVRSFLPPAPITRTNLQDRRIARSFSIGIDCGWAGLFRPRAPIALILLAAAIRRGSLRAAPRPRRDTRGWKMEARWRTAEEDEADRARAASRRDYNSDGCTVAV